MFKCFGNLYFLADLHETIIPGLSLCNAGPEKMIYSWKEIDDNVLLQALDFAIYFWKFENKKLVNRNQGRILCNRKGKI